MSLVEDVLHRLKAEGKRREDLEEVPTNKMYTFMFDVFFPLINRSFINLRKKMLKEIKKLKP